MKIFRHLLFLFLALPSIQHVKAVDIVDDFEIRNRLTGEPIRRSDFEGKIVIFDFLAYWCLPCHDVTKGLLKLEEDYKKQGGNPHGVEVIVVAVNIEDEAPKLTDKFIEEYDFHSVADDYVKEGGNGLYAQYRTGNIPLYLVMNGLKGGSHKQWEAMDYNNPPYANGTFYDSSMDAKIRMIIDSVAPGGVSEPNIVLDSPWVYEQNTTIASFPLQGVGTKGKPRILKIKNTGKRTLRRIRIKLIGRGSDDFVIRGAGNRSLKQGEKAILKIYFKPQSKGQKNAQLRIRSNDPDSSDLRLPISGIGT